MAKYIVGISVYRGNGVTEKEETEVELSGDTDEANRADLLDILWAMLEVAGVDGWYRRVEDE